VNWNFPGRINNAVSKSSTDLDYFEYSIDNGVNDWIKTKFEVACNNYGFNKNEILSESSKYTLKLYNYGSSNNTSSESNKNTNTKSSTPTTATQNVGSSKRYDIIKERSSEFFSEWGKLAIGCCLYRI